LHESSRPRCQFLCYCRFFSYFTHLSYIGVTTYFWASGVQTLAYAIHGQKTYPLQRWPRFLQFLHRLFYSSITTFPIIVTVVYWAILSSAETFSTRFAAWSNISQHAFNTVFILFEILLTRCSPSPWSHLPILILFLAGYLGIAYITHATEGFYSYSFLDPKKQHGLLAAYVIGIGVGQCVVFSAVWGMCYLRERFSSRLKRSAASGDVPEGHGHEEIDEWEEIDRPKTPSMNEV